YALAAGVPQPEVERVLERYLREKYGVAVEYGVEFVSVATRDDEVEVAVRDTASGATEAIRASFLIACDGGQSPVRHALGLQFKGHPVPAVFLNVDVHVRTQHPGFARGDQALAVIARKHGLFIIPSGGGGGGGGRARIVGPAEVPPPGRGVAIPAPTLRDVQAIADSRAPFLKATLHSPVWLSYFCSQQRKLEEHDYRPHPRVFMAGDAAHVRF
ncbi:MAG: FAD-binding monooxygenase, partial [Olpidium bornovanus]